MDAGSWLDGLEGRARPHLDPVVDAYVATGSRAGLATARAQAAWREPRLVPRTLVDVSRIDPSVTVLGRRLAVPWGVAPTTLQRAVHPDGERGVAEAVRLASGLVVVSSNAGTTVEDVGATGARWWLQLYLPQRRSLADALLDRAVAAGAEALVLTVDTPVVATKRGAAGTVWDRVPPEVVRVNFEPGHDDVPGAAKARDLGADDVDRLRVRTGLPVVVKGVLRPDDALRWVEAGAAAVWVSNHGGRQLDRVVPTATALPRVVAALDGAAEVYVDGGLRDGLDVVTALALGADCCFLGRPALWALAEGGRAGVERLHAALLDDVVEAMTLAGAPDVGSLRTLVDTPS